MFDVLITGGLVIDGIGRPGYRADLAVSGGRIAAIGELTGNAARTAIDATGLVVCPGFVDLHQHSDFTLLVNPRAESAIHQGVTTIVTGQCGHSCAPVRDGELITQTIVGYNPDWGVEIDWQSFGDYLQRLASPGLGVNVLPMLGHGAVRLAAMGFEERQATEIEIAAMCGVVAQAMDEGAAGLSWGLEYSPGRHADQAEMDALSRVVAERDGLYTIHVRDRAEQFVAATEEAVSVAERACLPIQLSHFAPRPYAPGNAFDAALARVQQASERGIRVGLDVFPRTWGFSIMDSAVLPPWVCAGRPDEVLVRLRQEEVRQAVRAYWAEQESYVLRAGGPKGAVLVHAPNSPDLVGLDFAQIADVRGVTMPDAVCDILLAEGEYLHNVLVRHIFATPEDLDRLLAQPNCALVSDGVAAAPYGPLADLRTTRDSYGYTAQFLQEYVRERPVFTLEEAVRRMTSLPAALCDVDDRGALAEGMMADVAVFDAAQISDQTTDLDPNRYPNGFEWMLVNGRVVLEKGQHTGRLPGELLHRRGVL